MSRLVEDLLALRDKICGKGHPRHSRVEDVIECMTKNWPESGGVTSWNDLPDRPFEEIAEVFFESENITDEPETLLYNNNPYAKVSSEAMTYKQKHGCVAFMYEDGSLSEEFDADFGYGMVDEGVYDVLCDKMVLNFRDDYKVNDVWFTTGVWVRWSEAYYVGKIECRYVKTIDSKFIPKATAVADVIEAPTAGQFNALLASLRAAGYLAT